MKKTIAAAFAALFCLVACQPMRTVQGKVVDATANNILVATAAGDTVLVCTRESDPYRVPAVLIGDVVRVKCAVEECRNGADNQALDLEILEPSYYRLIVGTWQAAVFGVETQTAGFTLAEDGTAVSVGLGVLDVRNWVLDGEELVLTGTAAGSTEVATEIYQIEKLDGESLVLADSEGNVVWEFTKTVEV